MGIQRYTFEGIDGLSSPEAAERWRETPAGKWVLWDDCAALVQALVKAKETIRALHGETAWDIYDRCSPEMKIINAALDGQP